MNEEYRDFLSELVAANARFLVVGAHALSVHGVPRATVDLDVWVDRTPENARRVWDALAVFGAPLDDLGIDVNDLTRPEIVMQIGLAPLRIDILTSVSGVAFDAAWSRRVEADFEGVRVSFIGRLDFIANKRASGRHKDLGDIESLGEHGPDDHP